MSRKKETTSQLSSEDHQQVQQLVEGYQHITQTIRNSSNQPEIEGALNAIQRQPVSVQIAFMKALARENSVDAADLLLAINTFYPSKEVRKEARRSLIRLEASRMYPQWSAPIAHTSVLQSRVDNPPRFWKGFVTQAREQGEVQLILAWEQGFDYTEIRSLIFLLDYWSDGIKDLIIETSNRRSLEEKLQRLREQLTDVDVVDCTLAEGKRLIDEALSINNWRGKPPVAEYRSNQAMINILINRSAPGEDRGLTFITPELTDQEMIINFLGAWSMGDYALTYDLLAQNSRLHNDFSRDEWIEQHRRWFDEAYPARLELGFVRERAQGQSGLWLPGFSGRNQLSTRKDVEIGWSLELTETPLNGMLNEMPMGTIINKETRRRWFWTSYSLVREQGGWRIQQIRDEGATIQGLPLTELQRRIKEYEQIIEEKAKQGVSQEFAEELSWRLTQLLHYYDAQLVQLPLDRALHEEAYGRAVITGNPERAIPYLERMARRFPENRADVLRQLGSALVGLAYTPNSEAISGRTNHLLTRAEETLREAIALQDNAPGHILLGEMFLSMNQEDEAEAELLKARAMASTTGVSPDDEATLETGLGNIALRRERTEEALSHFQRVAELDPSYPSNWFNLGFTYRLLEQFTEAEAIYQRAIQEEPYDIRSYSELVAIYMNRLERHKARALAEQGIRNNPRSAHLHALFASVLLELGDRRGAQQQLEEAESINPKLEIVQAVRQFLHSTKKH